jgi:hypothetical protein
MADIYPEVGMAGALQARAPFDTIIKTQVRYTCISVESLRGVVALGEDPFGSIYSSHGLTSEDYTRDLADDVKIITLQAITGEIVKIPHNYLITLPDPAGVLYSMVMLGVNLSAIPDGLDLTVLKDEISQLVLEQLGVNSTIKEIVYGASTLIPTSKHRAVNATRLLRIRDNQSSRAKVKQLTQINQDLRERIGILEDYIAKHYVPEER